MMEIFLLTLIGVSCAAIAMALALRAPHWFVWLYLLNFTRFFGFLNPAWVEVRGLVNLNLYFNLILIAAVVWRLNKSRFLDGPSRTFLFVVSAFFLYGVIAPVFRGDSHVVASFVDGKDFLAYGLLAYLWGWRSPQLAIQIKRAIVVLAVGLAIVVLAAEFLGVSLPGNSLLLEEMGAEGGTQIRSPTLMQLGFVLLTVDALGRRVTLRCIIPLLVILIGLVLQGHRSALFGALGAGAAMVILQPSIGSWIRLAVVVPAAALLVVTLVGEETRAKVFGDTWAEIVLQEGAIGSRIEINRFRMAASTSRPILGYGFVDEASDLGREFAPSARTRYEATLGTVDAGYVDILVRFGIAGLVGFALIYLLVIWRGLGLRTSTTMTARASALFLLSYFGVAATWSVFTYDFGIIPACIAAFLILWETRSRPESRPSDAGKVAVPIRES